MGVFPKAPARADTAAPLPPSLLWLQPPSCNTSAADSPPGSFMPDSAPCSPSTGPQHPHSDPLPDPHLLLDPDLAGKTVLLVLTGSPGRRRILQSLHAAGLRIACYTNPAGVISGQAWASQYITYWISGPIDDSAAATSCVQSWLTSQAQGQQQQPASQAWQAGQAQGQQQQQPTSQAGLTNQTQGQQQQQQQAASQAWLACQAQGQQHHHQQPVSLPQPQLHGIMCYDEYGVQLASELGQALGLPYTRPCVVEALRNKHVFREACRAGGVACPRFTRLTGPLEEGDHNSIQGLRFPVVAKPAACAGSFSVVLCESECDLRDASRRYFDALPGYLAGLGLGNTSACAAGGMVVEEQLVGHEVDIDCVVVRGELVFAAVSDNHPPNSSDDGHAFLERGGRCPSVLPLAQQADLLQLASDVVGLWGEGLSGVFHLEAFATPDGPVPIELNGRVGGAETYTNILTAWGLDLGLQAARIALGYPPQLSHVAQLVHVVPAVEATAVAAAPLTLAEQLVALQLQLQPLSEHLVLSPPLSCITCSTCSTCGSSRSSCDHTPRDDASCCSHLLTLHNHHNHQGTAEHAPHLLTLHNLQQHTEHVPEQLAAAVGTAVTAVAAAAAAAGAVAVARRALAGNWSIGGDGGDSRGAWDHMDHMYTHASSLSWSHADGPLRVRDPSSPPLDIELTLAPGMKLSKALISHQLISTQLAATGSPSQLQQLAAAGVQQQLQPQATRCLRLAQPLTHVYSINFVPDWRGVGVVDQLEVTESVKQSVGYVDHELYVQRGAVVKLPPAGYGALGWMVGQGCSSEGAEGAMQELMQGVNIVLKEPGA